MSNGDQRQYLTFRPRQWLALGSLVVGMPIAMASEAQPQADWSPPLDAALAGLPDLGWYMTWALWAAALATAFRLVVELLYGLMRPYRALRENTVLGALARYAAFALSVIIVGVVAMRLLDNFEPADVRL